MPKRQSLPQDLQDAFENLLCALSPENLSCDGEASKAQIRAKIASINEQWTRLETKAGRPVPRAEVEKNSMRQ